MSDFRNRAKFSIANSSRYIHRAGCVVQVKLILVLCTLLHEGDLGAGDLG